MREHFVYGLLPIFFLVILVSAVVANDEIARETFNGYVSQLSQDDDSASPTNQDAMSRNRIRNMDRGQNRQGENGVRDRVQNRNQSRDGSCGNGSNGSGNQNRQGENGVRDRAQNRNQSRDGSCGNGFNGSGNQNRNRTGDRGQWNSNRGSGNGSHHGGNNDIAPNLWSHGDQIEQKGFNHGGNHRGWGNSQNGSGSGNHRGYGNGSGNRFGGNGGQHGQGSGNRGSGNGRGNHQGNGGQNGHRGGGGNCR